MKKFLTDMHTHSKYSHDGQAELSVMLETAHAQGVGFYGVSEHFDYDYDTMHMTETERWIDDTRKQYPQLQAALEGLTARLQSVHDEFGVETVDLDEE